MNKELDEEKKENEFIRFTRIRNIVLYLSWGDVSQTEQRDTVTR